MKAINNEDRIFIFTLAELNAIETVLARGIEATESYIKIPENEIDVDSNLRYTVKLETSREVLESIRTILYDEYIRTVGG